MNQMMKKIKKICKCIRKPLGWILVVLGLLLAAACYYVLFFMTKPAEYLAPPSYNPAPGRNEFKVAVFSDWMQASGAIEKIAQESHDRKAAFAVCCGDFVHPAQPAVMKQAVRLIKKNFSIPVYATPGNHDVYNAEDVAGFSAVFGNVNNCFAYGDSLFILLETAKKELSKEQLKFLEFVLTHERPKYRRCVIFTHVPPTAIAQFDKPKYRLKAESASALLKLLEFGNVDMIICGHVHHEMAIDLGKTKLLVCPTSGQGSRNRKNPQFGSLQLHFKSDGSIKYEFVYCGRTFVAKSKIVFRLNQRAILFSLSLVFIFVGSLCISGFCLKAE